MIITCEKCSTRYKVADDIIDKPAFKVRCHNCNHRFMVYKPVEVEDSFLLEDVIAPDFNRVITISNQKGGVAKTTTCLNLGVALAKMGKKVLLIDFDVQANLTILLGFRKTGSFYDVLEGDSSDLTTFIEETNYSNLSLLPSNSRMALLKKKYLNAPRFEYLLKDRLDRIKDDYDHVIIDTPPSIEFFTLNAMVAANLIVIPSTCEYLAMHGINQINDIVAVLKKSINPEVDFKVLITMHKPDDTSEKVILRKIKSRYKDNLFVTVIEDDSKMKESHIINMPIAFYAEDSTSAQQYHSLAREVAS